jgi:septum site-determining protein MinC
MATTRNALPDYEQAGELKMGQVGIANLRIRQFDVARLAQEMRERVQRAPKMFERAAVILDFSALSALPPAAQVADLVDALRDAGALPCAIAYGTPAMDALARDLGLPVLAKFRAAYERSGEAEPAPAQAPPPRAPEPAPAPTPPPVRGEPGLIHSHPIRSGQQVYAAQRDLTVLTTVGAGAEVLADGSIHIYGALRGRALAGASGFTGARIFCREFHAELVAIAGHYKVLEDIPATLRGKPVQVWLDASETLQIQVLD